MPLSRLAATFIVQGNLAYKNQDFQGAEILYSKAIVLNSKCGSYFAYRSAARFEQGKFNAALEDALYSIELDGFSTDVSISSLMSTL